MDFSYSVEKGFFIRNRLLLNKLLAKSEETLLKTSAERNRQTLRAHVSLAQRPKR